MTGLLLLGWLALAGCTTINHMQFEVSPVEKAGPSMVISDADREAVREILRARAAQLRLVDRTDTSLVPQTIGFYMEPDSDNPIKLLAWESGAMIVVDFMHAPGEVGETLQFRNAREQLFYDLQERFQGRVKMVPIRKQVTAGESFRR